MPSRRPPHCTQGHALDSDDVSHLLEQLAGLVNIGEKLTTDIRKTVALIPALQDTLEGLINRVTDDLELEKGAYRARLRDLQNFRGDNVVYSTPSMGYRGRSDYAMFTLLVSQWQRAMPVSDGDDSSSSDDESEDADYDATVDMDTSSVAAVAGGEEKKSKRVTLLDHNRDPVYNAWEVARVLAKLDSGAVFALLSDRVARMNHCVARDECPMGQQRVQINGVYYRVTCYAKVVYMWVPLAWLEEDDQLSPPATGSASLSTRVSSSSCNSC